MTQPVTLNPEALDKALQVTGSRSVDHLAQTFLGKTGATVRRWVKGQSAPDLVSIVRLQKLTGLRFDQLIIDHNPETVAA